MPERLTKAELLDIITEKSHRFRSDSVPAETVTPPTSWTSPPSSVDCARTWTPGCGITPDPTKGKDSLWAPDSFQLTEEKHPSVNEMQERRAKGISITDCLDALSKRSRWQPSASTARRTWSNIEVVKMPDVLVVTFCRFKLTESLPIKISYLH